MLKWIVSLFIAGVLAAMLWPKPEPYETDIFVPVDISVLPEGLALTGIPLEGVEIRVRGPEKMVRSLSDRQLQYRLDLSGVAAGIQSIPVSPERLGLPREIAILHVHPDPLILRVEKEVSKEVPVRVMVSGEPASGFFLADTRPIPSSAVLKGPESRIDTVKEVRTKPIDITGAHQSMKEEVALDLMEGVQAVTPGGVILAEVTLAEQFATRTFPAVPLIGKNCPHRFTITPSQIEIEIKGPVNTLEKLQAKGIEVYVDLEGLSPGVYPRRAVIALPVETTLLKATPEIFGVEIETEGASGAKPQPKTPKTAPAGPNG